MSTLTELGDFLQSAGVGIQEPIANANLYLGSRPDSPDLVLALYQYPGGPPEYLQESFSPSAERVQIQVVTRANTYEEADAFAWRAWKALAPITNAVIGGTKYRSVRPNHSPAIMGRDTNDRILVFFNATVDKEVSVVV